MKINSILAPVLGLIVLTGAASAATVTYTVDPAQSSLSLVASYSNFAITEQTPGALTTFYSGSITGDLIGTTITFSGGSSVVAGLNTVAPFAPASSSVGSVDNYGGLVTAAPGLSATIAFRSIVFDIMAPETAGDVMSFEFLSGFADYDATALGVGAGTIDLVAEKAGNAGVATITTSGLTETLTIPVNVSYSGDVTASFRGQIVAVRTIPEPSAALLGLLGLTTVIRRRRSA